MTDDATDDLFDTLELKKKLYEFELDTFINHILDKIDRRETRAKVRPYYVCTGRKGLCGFVFKDGTPGKCPRCGQEHTIRADIPGSMVGTGDN